MTKTVPLLGCCLFLVALAFGSMVSPANIDYGDGETVKLWSCKANYTGQQWRLVPSNNYSSIRLMSTDEFCFDISGYGTANGSLVWLWDCHTDDTDPTHQNQEFIYNANGTLVNPEARKCLTTSDAPPYQNGTQIVLYNCAINASDPLYLRQRWSLNVITGVFTTLWNSGTFCVDVGSTYPPPCDPANIGSKLPYCNYSLPYSTRALDLISRLSLTDKAGLLANGASSVPSLQLADYQWWSEALHGVAYSPGVSFQAPTPYATSFPQVCTSAASFNKTLFHQIGSAVGLEGRAMSNVGTAGLTFWAPNINIFRDPRWGRGQETPGEDPVHNSYYVYGFVRGMQSSVLDPGHLQVSACCKHFDAYSLENWNGVSRHQFDAIVTARDLADTYLPPFKTCASDAGGSGVMCSYNAVNGVPSCASSYLLTQKLLNEWGFYGYITSDCGAVADVIYSHHYTNTTAATVKAVLAAGMDIDCGSFLYDYTADAVNSGGVSVDMVNGALYDLILVQMRLGIFDPDTKQPFKNVSVAAVNSPAHQQLALQAAREGIVLLKNLNSRLPIAPRSISSIAVVGPNANATGTLQGNYYGNAPYLVTVLDGISTLLGTSDIVYYNQGSDINSNDTRNFSIACKYAAVADMTVLVMGLDQSQEAEGLDRYSIALPGVQPQFIQAVAACAGGMKPVVLVMMNGGPVDLSAQKADSNIDAILWVGYPGQSGGQAVAEAIFGVFSPAGRLPYTVYPAGYVDTVSMFDMEMRPNTTSGNPGRSYRFYQGTPVYQFGEGYSYTTFLYSYIELLVAEDVNVHPKAALGLLNEKNYMNYHKNEHHSNVHNDIVKVNAELLQSFLKQKPSRFDVTSVALSLVINVTNVGGMASQDSVLGFISGPDAGNNGNPIKSLFDYSKVYLGPGNSTIVILRMVGEDFSVVNEDGVREIAPGKWTITVGDLIKEIHVVQ